MDAYNLMMDEELIEEYGRQQAIWARDKLGPSYSNVYRIRLILYKRGWKLNAKQDLWEKS